MQKIKKVHLFIDKKSLEKIVEKIYDLVRSKSYLLKDTRKVFATKLHNFVTVMKTWGWNVSKDESGNVIGIDYFGDSPISYQKILFENIAPHIQSGSFIKFEIDNKKEIWEFDGKHMLMS